MLLLSVFWACVCGNAIGSNSDIVFYDKSSGAPYYSAIDIIGEGVLAYVSDHKIDDDNPNSHFLNIKGSINGQLMSMISHQGYPDMVKPLCEKLKKENLKSLLTNAHFDNVKNPQVSSAINRVIDEEKKGYGHSLDIKCILDFTKFNKKLYWLNNSCRTRNRYGGYSNEACQSQLKYHDQLLSSVFAYASIVSKLNEKKLKDRLIKQDNTELECKDIYSTRRSSLVELSERVERFHRDNISLEKSRVELASLEVSYRTLPAALACNNTGLKSIDELIKLDQNLIKKGLLRLDYAKNLLNMRLENHRLEQVMQTCDENRNSMYSFDLRIIDRVTTKFEILDVFKSLEDSADKIKNSIVEIDSLLKSLQMIRAPDECLANPEYKKNFLEIIKYRTSLFEKLDLYKASFNSVKSDDLGSIRNESALTNKMATYTALIGRAIGCGYDVSERSAELGEWIDKTFSYDLKMKTIYIKIATDGLGYYASLQSKGDSLMTCMDVSKSLEKLNIK
jgi:hypothetical protein